MSNPYAVPRPPSRQTPDTRPLRKRKRVWAAGVALLLVGSCMGAAGGDGPTRSAPAPEVTATVTAEPDPEPTVTVTETVTATAEPEEEDGSGDDNGSGSSDDGSRDGSTGGGSSGGGSTGTTTGGGGGGGVYYSNCSEARAAGAAPVHRGEPGYGSHLDRDGDGTGCDS